MSNAINYWVVNYNSQINSLFSPNFHLNLQYVIKNSLKLNLNCWAHILNIFFALFFYALNFVDLS